MKLPNLNLQRWFSPGTPRLATSAGHDERFGPMLFSSRSGGDGNDNDNDFPDDDPDFEDTTVEPPRASRGGGGGRGGGSGGRQRTIQFQPEDRYWTEYLRIALPIIGLILLLGLFWYWATQIIGDDTDKNEPVPTQTVGQVETIAAPPTEPVTPTTETTVAVTPEETPAATEAPTQPAGGDNAATETPATDEETPTEGAGDNAAGGEFQADEIVVTTEDVNLRSEPSTAGGDSTVVDTLSAGTRLQIIEGPEEGDNYTWYKVMVIDDGTEGWTVVDFIEAEG